MSSNVDQEPTLTDRIGERPSFDARKAGGARPRDLLIRFAAGGITSIVSGALTIAFGPRVGGIFLAFPAILGASLTLIEEQEGSVDAREDSRGSILGACAMALFAIAATLALGHIGGAIALLIASAIWVVAALSLYLILWWR